MESPENLDFARLLSPIPGDDPAGPDLRRDPSPESEYILLKDAHRRARNLEREQEAPTADRTTLTPDWRLVLDSAQRVLAEKSKDVEVMAWLIEALGRVHGFAGLRDGFRLAAGLVERFWDQLHSVEGDDGKPDRAAPLAALNGLGSEGPLPAVIRRIAITDAKGRGPFALWQYQQATRAPVSQDEATRGQIQAENQALREQMVQSAKQSGVLYFRNLIDDIEACRTRFNELQEALKAKCGAADAPSGANIRSTLEAVSDAVLDIARDLPLRPEGDSGAAEKDAVNRPETGMSAAMVRETGPVVPTGPVRSREEAFRTLLAVADFFRQYEPHSPISYTLEELVRRGRMSLPELLDELIPDEGARRAYLQSAGIKPPAASE
jgi:type VI secretion system protein ImpA